MDKCETEGCEKEAVSLIARPDGNIQMCWNCHQDFIESEADYLEYILMNR